MSGIYSVEDLLKLRASPLICKPPNLPAIEEWMGPSEPSGRRPVPRTSKDEPLMQTETFQKRPTLLDSQRRTTTDPDRIVLGPPRRSFASSSARAAGRAQDAADEKDRTTFGDRTKTGEEHERQHERRHTQTNGRYANRQESEDPEPEGRREYDRKPKWAGRDRGDHDQDNDQALEEPSRGPRRDTLSRAKLSQSWFRKDIGDAEEDKAPDWRRDRGRDRDWDRDRNAKAEAEPEWMDSAEPEEPFQARTQEDFQRWKERMKAGGAAPLEKIETAVASPPPEEKPSAKRVVSAEPDDSMDKFLARFESKATEQKAAVVKPHGKSKFASLFSPSTEQNKQVEFPSQQLLPPTERPSSAEASGPATDADQAGFARILEMLQTRSNNPTPHSQEAPKPRTPLYARASEQRAEPEARPPQLDLIALLGGESEAAQQKRPDQDQPVAPQHRSIDTESPVPQSVHTRQQPSINKDEVLLSLLRQASLAPKPHPPPPAGSGLMFGSANDTGNRPINSRGVTVSPIQAEQHAFRAATRGSMFDDSPVSMYPSDQATREQGTRRPTNGTQPSQEDLLISFLRGQQTQQRPAQPTQQSVQGYPPGLHRPPGLDQLPRQNPNWVAQQAPAQQQPPRQPSLPPGLANIPRSMSGAPYGQPQQIPIQQVPQQRPQQPQRKYTSESAMPPPNLPPGMYPPPGFMNAGPPPGFPGGMGNHPAARFGVDPGPQQRAFMEMYGEVGGRGLGLRGGAGNGGMPPYR
ncbi:hypothetical protein G647_07941 [Cladophialophora carrionii CBS 160.54]|uniref:Uncharacterized protein n=1 Tax=Cladophialophora carrionii CBS 160.54 TaxID=1279043 RepID=V9D3W7_9EURO|nr:uncharacterized protein G647_07941 [Cladophialophora carrionii CBS 160.54]ETI21594.1 hypothetical protein G647_07941 [Cladophialophora carrionii CBS 160.54]